MIVRAEIQVNGIVQGVGFRPFVYRIASEKSLNGYVLNLGDAGVEIVVEGSKSQIESMISEIENNPPSIARIESLTVHWRDGRPDEFSSFVIRKSSIQRREETVSEIPPDIATCEKCVEDLFNPESRWYRYPFTSCAACGPRFSTITDLPYDRPNTTMEDFPLCNTCNIGYTNPLDRRYHAQTTACESCGPIYELIDSQGKKVVTKNLFQMIAELLEEESILAIQGISGTHLVTKTSTPGAILKLRQRKKRSSRPFAIMVRDLETLQLFADVSDIEMEHLKSWRRPIVLVAKKENIDTSNVIQILQQKSLEQISPGLDTIGAMLPYAPIHRLLFDACEEAALVMTSANPSGMPMYIDHKEIVRHLGSIADFFLVHNRRIEQRADDSVIKFVDESDPVFIRRSRGYVPEPIALFLPSPKLQGISVGPEEKVTAAILKSNRAYLTQHIGDTDNLETLDFLLNAIEHTMHLVGVDSPHFVACDLHPEFLTTELAFRLGDRWNAEIHQIPHHHAHLAAIAAENKINCDTDIICITANGFGYSPQGDAWGGEILLGDCANSIRVGGLTPHHIPGGDLSARYAIRSLIGILESQVEDFDVSNLAESIAFAKGRNVTDEQIGLLVDLTKKRINTVYTTSAGRFLDAVSLALGICTENTYDGECPMKLEAAAKETDYRLEVTYESNNGIQNLKTKDLLLQAMQERCSGRPIHEIAYAVQRSLGEGLANIACSKAHENGVEYVGFSGGVALNRIIHKAIKQIVHNEGLSFIHHRLVPPGDGGISLGQVTAAAARESL